MTKILISKNDKYILERLKESFPDPHSYLDVRYVTVFSDNENFLITKYSPLNQSVNLILELEDSTEIHITASKCGYLGTGPRTTVEVLKFFGINTDPIEKFIFTKPAVKFEVKNHEVVMSSLDFTYLFCHFDKSQISIPLYKNKINLSQNVSVDFQCRKATFFNPQRHSWNGFVHLLSYVQHAEMEYYIGENSPLDDSFYVGNEFMGNFYSPHNTADIKDTNQVCMVLKGDNFRVVCLVDEKYEMQVVDAIHISLKGKPLFNPNDYQMMQSKKALIKTILQRMKKRKQDAIYGIIKIQEGMKK